MAEYIERKATIELLRSLGSRDYRREKGTIQEAIKMVSITEYTPAADVAPVVHGRWVGLEYDGYADGAPVYDLWECSECGEEVRGEDVPETHLYCPNCGAKMDGGEDDGA